MKENSNTLFDSLIPTTGQRLSERRSRRVAFFASVTALVINTITEIVSQFDGSGRSGLSWTNVIMIFSIFCYATAAFLQKGRYDLAGKILLTLSGVVQITALSFLIGIESQVHLFLLLPLVSSVLIFSSQQRFWRAIAISLCAAAFIYIEVAFSFFNFKQHLPIEPQNVLRVYLIVDIVLLTISLSGIVLFFAFESESNEASLEREQEKNIALLENMLPKSIVKRLIKGENRIAERHSNVTVLFADLVGFTNFSRGVSADRVVNLLDDLFCEFDDIALELGAEKIKTIGDSYMVVVGFDESVHNHAEVATRFGIRILNAVKEWNLSNQVNLDLRVGIHSGEVVAGVIGRRRFAFDLWGDTVNTASRMESNGEAGAVVVSNTTAQALGGSFPLVQREVRFIKGLGETVTWLVAPI